MPSIEDLINKGVNHYSFYKPEKPESEQGDMSRGFEKAMRQIPQTAGGAAALVGDLVGSDGLKDYGLGVYNKQEEAIQKITKPSDSFSSVLEGEGSPIDFLQSGIGYVGGQALTALATGGAGGFIGAQLAKQGAKQAIAAGVAKEVAAQAVKRGAIMGAGTAAFGSNLMQEAGSIYPEALQQAEKDGRTLDGMDKARIVGSSLAAAGVDTAMEGVMAGRLLHGGRKAGESMVRAAGREVPLAMAREGATEGIQTGIERFGAGQDLTTADAIRDYVDSAALGALGGGLGGGASVLRAQKVPDSGPLSRAANDGLEAQAQHIEQNPEAVAAAQAEAQAQAEAEQKAAQPEPKFSTPEKADETLTAWAAQHDPEPLDRAQAMLAAPGTKGDGLMVAPHPAGGGYTLIPSKYLSLDQQVEYAPLQKPAKDGEKPAAETPSQAPEEVPPAPSKQPEEAHAAFNDAADRVLGGTGGDVSGTGTDSTGGMGGDAQPGTGLQPGGGSVLPGSVGTTGPEDSTPELIMNPQGETFKTEMSAKRKLKEGTLAQTHEIVKSPESGWFLQKKAEATPVAAAPVAEESAKVGTFAAAAHEAASSPNNDLEQPTAAQIAAGNPKLGHGKINGLNISIENPAGSVREDKANTPPKWSTEMKDHYGYFKGVPARASDKDHVDVFVKDGTPDDFNGTAFIVDQNHGNGHFDEPKVIVGASDLEDAKATYLRNYDAGFESRIRNITPVSMDELKARLQDAETFTKPQPVAEGVDSSTKPKPVVEQAAPAVEPVTSEAMEQPAAPAAEVVEKPKPAKPKRVTDRAAKVAEKEAAVAAVADVEKPKAIRKRQAKKLSDAPVAASESGDEALGRGASADAIDPFDQTLLLDIAKGGSTNDVLSRIESESANPQYRELAAALKAMGLKTTIEFGDATGAKFAVKGIAAAKFAAGYKPKADQVLLFMPKGAEVSILHELTHASTFKAIRSGGLAARQMTDLYRHVEQTGVMKGLYAMENLDEFVAEAFSNPQIQNLLRDITAMPSGSAFRNAWDKFVAIVRGILGLKNANALDQVMKAGAALMEENKAIRATEAGETVLGSVGAAYDMLKSAKTLGETTDTLKNMLLKSERKFNLWDKTISTQFNKATKDSDFKRVFDAYNQQTEDTAHYAIEAERLAPGVLQRLDNIKDIGKALVNSGGKFKADLEAASKALFANIEGKEGVQQKLYTDAELRSEFKLTDPQILMYRQVRAAIDTSIDRLAQTTIASMGEAAGMDISALKNLSAEETAKAVIDGTDTGRIGKDIGGNTRNVDLHERINELLDRTNDLKAKAYMPAMRFGEYAVTVRDAAGGDPIHFEMFESQTAANIAAMKLAKEYPGKVVDKSVLNPDAYAMFKGVSPETVQLFATFSGMDQNEAYKDYIALAKSSRSTLQRLQNRKGTAGFSEDATRVLASFLTSNARQSAMNMNAGEVNAAMASPTLARKGDVQREAQKLHEYMSNPREEAQKLRGFLFMHFIGGSIASSITNLTQPILQTTPYLSQYAGGKTAGIMASSARMAVTGKIDNADLRAAMEKAKADGIVDPAEIHMLMADASGATLGTSLRARALTKAWGSFFALSESYNRRLTFLAAYQTAMHMGQDKLTAKGFKDAYAFAQRAIIETQGLYSKTNRPNWARGAVGATLFTFKQFSISYIEFFNRLPNKQKALALGILIMAAGVQGIPFADDLEDLIDTLGQTLGYNTNSKKWVRDHLLEVFGDDLGEILTSGISQKTGVDMSGRLGMGNLIPGTGLLKMSEPDKSRDVAEVAGALGGVLTSFQKAFGRVQAGDYAGGAREMAPTAIKNALQGVDMAQTGSYKDGKGRKVRDVDMVDAVIKGLGFQPQQIASETRKISDMMQDKGMRDAVKHSITDRLVNATFDGDQAGVAKAREVLAEWNLTNDDRITISPVTIRQRLVAMRQTREQRFLKTVPKALRAQAREDLAD